MIKLLDLVTDLFISKWIDLVIIILLTVEDCQLPTTKYIRKSFVGWKPSTPEDHELYAKLIVKTMDVHGWLSRSASVSSASPSVGNGVPSARKLTESQLMGGIQPIGSPG